MKLVINQTLVKDHQLKLVRKTRKNNSDTNFNYNMKITEIAEDYKSIGLVGRVFIYSPGDKVSIPGRVIPKTLKIVLGTSLLNTQQYKVRIKGKVEQSRERSSTLLYTSM